jgi:hypothetical protein
MKLYIPDIGDVIKLSSPWTFNLHYEHRNDGLLEYFGFKTGWGMNADQYEKVTLPLGVELKVDRIYIRKGAGSFSSLTFYAQNLPNHKGSVKFWSKLRDINRIETETTASTGILKFPIMWGYDNLPYKDCSNPQNKGKNLIGKVNSVDAFEITVSNLETIEKINNWNQKYKYVTKIKYKLTCLVSGDAVGEWGTISTMKNKAKEYINSHMKYFVDDEQKMALREEKLERIVKE